jgi:hypothetical protein
MKTQVLTGSKSEIADKVARMPGPIREVLVFLDEPTNSSPGQSAEDIFAEMEPFTVSVGCADDSRESLYTRMEGE